MKFTVVLIGLISLSSSWAAEKAAEEQKDKREAPLGYPSSGHSTQTLQIQPSHGHDDSNTISIGAGYSVGGAKGFGGLAPASGLHYGGLQSGGGHQTIQLPPITLQPNHGGSFAASDLHQLMDQLSHGLSTGALQLQPAGGSQYQGLSYGQESAQPQYSFGGQNVQEYSVSEHQQPSVPSYAIGTKGLGSYAGASTGPVLFNPADNAQYAQSSPYTAGAGSGHSFGDASFGGGHSFGEASLGSSGHSFGGASQGGSGHSFGGASQGGAGHSFGGASQGGAGHSFGGASLGGSGHSFGGASLGGSGHSFGGSPSGLSGHSFGGSSLGGSGHSFGGPSLSGSGHSFGGPSLGGSGHSFSGASFKTLGGSYGAPAKTSFKPSAFLGASVQNEGTHAISGLSTHAMPSFGHSYAGAHVPVSSGGHSSISGYGNFGGGSSKFIAPSYLPPKTFGTSLEALSAFSGGGHSSSPPGTTYGFPAASHGLASASSHGASSSPQYYLSSSKQGASFGEGSSSFKAPISSHASFSTGPKYSSGGQGGFSSRYQSKDSHGDYSEPAYNTIKYSEPIRPRSH